MGQVNASVCTGTGKLGKLRLKLYRQKARAKGHRSFSAYVKELLDKESQQIFPKVNGNGNGVSNHS